MPQVVPNSGKGLSNRDKGILIGAIVCILIAALAIFFTWKGQQIQVTKNLNLPPGTAPKLQAMKAMREGKNPGAANPAGMEFTTPGVKSPGDTGSGQ